MGIRRMQYGRLILLTASVLIASLIVNLFLRRGIGFEYLSLSIYEVEQYEGQSGLGLVLYVLFTRLKHLAVIFILMRIVKPEYVYCTVIGMFGVMFGALITVQSYYDGISGVFLLLLYLLPHYVIYGFLLRALYEFFRSANGDKEKMKYVVVILLLLVAGVFSEGFFSRFFLNRYYQYMVSP